MDRQALRTQLALLAHHNPTEIVALDQTGERAVVKGHEYGASFDEIAEHVEKADRPPFSIYVGIYDRRPGLTERATENDLVAVSCVVLDVDPIRDGGSRTMATEGQRIDAKLAADAIRLRLAEDLGYLPGALADSGNGCTLYLPIPRIELADEGEFHLKVRRWLREIRPWVRNFPVKIDATFDRPRLTRVVGTTNRKGPDESLWRESRWIETPS